MTTLTEYADNRFGLTGTGSFSALQDNLPPKGDCRFRSFDEIPIDKTGLIYPDYDYLYFCRPMRLGEHSIVVHVDGLSLLASHGDEAFLLNPHAWHYAKLAIASGKVEYPEVSGEFMLVHGRHRLLALMKIYGRPTVPVAVDRDDYDRFLDHLYHADAHRVPHAG